MGTNQVGRGRSVGVGQQELELRLPKRSGSSTEASVVFQRGLPDLTHVLREVMSTPPKILAAQQGMADLIGPAMTPNARAVATGAIKNPALSFIAATTVTPQQGSGGKPAEKVTAAYNATRKLLSDPAQQAYLASSREKLVLRGQAENLDFLIDLKKFRDNPSLAGAKELKRIYIDSIDDDFDLSKVSADQFGILYETKAINITAKDRKTFLSDFDGCIKQIERGESLSKSGLPLIFTELENHASFLLIKELQKLKNG
jgi:hypothetical protein